MVQSLHPVSPNQIGFKKGHRTSDHIFVLKTVVDKIVKSDKGNLFVAFIDFRKAYDRIKLRRLGVNGLLYKNIKALYESVSYEVKVKGGRLEPITSRFGLKQGGVLSPLLFNLFNDDMKNIFDDSCDPVRRLTEPLSHLLYADDLAITSTTESGLKSSLSKLESYCTLWQLEVNIKNSKVVIFNRSERIISGQNFTFHSKPLDLVISYCYLGIDMSCSGSFQLSRTNLIDKAQKAVCRLLSTTAQFKLPCSKTIKLFESMSRPIA